MKKLSVSVGIALFVIISTMDVCATMTRTVVDSVIHSWNRQDITVPMMEGAKAVDLVLDSLGNSYIVGTSFTPDNQFDIVTIKYDSTGKQLWMAQYDGPAHGWDEARGIALAADGCILVAGNSRGDDQKSHYVLINYSPDGKELWHAVHDGTMNLPHQAIKPVAVNRNGDIFVCGNLEVDGFSSDFLIMKYASDGSLIWTATYNGLGNSSDQVRTIALMPSGEVVVTGTSDRGDSSSFATVLYDTLGHQVWACHYRGESGSLHNQVVDMAIDGIGDIIVTGLSRDAVSAVYATVKYDIGGREVWSTRYNGDGNSASYHEPVALISDPVGNIYVTGYDQNEYGVNNFVTVKYSPDGERIWSANTSGLDNTSKKPTGMALDGSGHLIVTGFIMNHPVKGASILTLQYDPSGNLIRQIPLTNSDDANDCSVSVAVSSRNEIFILGNRIPQGGNSQWQVIKYDSSGGLVWEKIFSGSGYRMTFYCSMKTTPAGHVAVAVAAYNKGAKTDCMTQVFDSEGNRLWQAWYDGPAHSYDFPTNLVVDAENNVLITGSSTGVNNNDLITIKYNPLGQESWSARYNGPANGADQGTALAVDTTGNVIVVGYSIHPVSHADFVTIKYSPSGEMMWSALYNGASDSSDFARAVAVDCSGSIYVAGESLCEGSGNDLVIIKYDADGHMLWERRYNNPNNTSDALIALALDPCGHPILAGNIVNSARNYQYVVLKLNPEGEILWSRIPEFEGYLSALTLNREGQIYLTGSAYIRSSHDDYAVVKLDSEGNVLWQTFSQRPSEDSGLSSQAITVDDNGNVYITGNMYWGVNYNRKYLMTSRYSPDGELQWFVTSDVGAQNTVRPRAIVLDAAQRVYVAAWIQSDKPPLVLMVQQYLQPTTGVTSARQPSGFEFALKPAYPNPFNPATTISFTLPSTQLVSLKIYDLLGREAATLFSGKLEGGEHTMRWQADGMPAGIYFCRLQAGMWNQIQKLINLQ